MEIDITNLNAPKIIDEDITIEPTIYHYDDIIALNDLHLSGSIYYNASDNLEFSLLLTGNMVLKDSVTLDNIDYPLNLKINEEYEIDTEFLNNYVKNKQNILDIIPILWENIVLEVPMSLTKTENAQASGEGWSLNGNNKDDDIDPRLAKLQEILDRKE